ncbi:MAG: hypothetical protein ACYSRQ_07180 [Planctomycetota bacterium]|jgi:hypothetical protein
MKNEKLFKNLVTQAQKETHPQINISENVLAVLSPKQKRVQFASYRPLAWVASLSTAAAACILVTTWFVWQNTTTDAMTNLYQMISWVAQ